MSGDSLKQFSGGFEFMLSGCVEISENCVLINGHKVVALTLYSDFAILLGETGEANLAMSTAVYNVVLFKRSGVRCLFLKSTGGLHEIAIRLGDGTDRDGIPVDPFRGRISVVGFDVSQFDSFAAKRARPLAPFQYNFMSVFANFAKFSVEISFTKKVCDCVFINFSGRPVVPAGGESDESCDDESGFSL